MQAKLFLKLEDWWTFDDGRIPRLQGSELLHVWWVERSDDGKLNVHFPTFFAAFRKVYCSETSLLFIVPTLSVDLSEFRSLN
jgi:hypothetical protein